MHWLWARLVCVGGHMSLDWPCAWIWGLLTLVTNHLVDIAVFLEMGSFFFPELDDGLWCLLSLCLMAIKWTVYLPDRRYLKRPCINRDWHTGWWMSSSIAYRAIWQQCLYHNGQIFEGKNNIRPWKGDMSLSLSVVNFKAWHGKSTSKILATNELRHNYQR